MKPVRLMKPHPAATLFPLLGEAELCELIADIEAHGVRQPIVLHWGLVLDGRNRIRACDQLGLDPPFVEYEGNDPVGFVISVNLRRRHLHDGARAIVAARLATLAQGNPTGANQHAGGKPPIGGIPPAGTASPALTLTQDEAAELLGVSLRNVQRARVVIDHGDPELVAAVECSEASLSAAAAVASLPVDEQIDAVRSGKVAAVAKRLRRPATIVGEARHEPEAAGGAGEGWKLPPDPRRRRSRHGGAIREAGEAVGPTLRHQRGRASRTRGGGLRRARRRDRRSAWGPRCVDRPQRRA